MSTNYRLIKYFWIFLYVIKQLIIKIKCDCEGCTGTNCRQVFTGVTETCMSCTNLNNNNNYYEYISESCQKIDASSITSEKFLIYNTKQIVDTCNGPYLYKIGSICYKNKPKNSEQGEDGKYKCLYNYTKETNDNLVYLNCLDQYENCPSEYKYLTYINNNYYKCTKNSNDCDEENIYEEKIGDDTIYYCLSECPSTRKYYYTEGDNKKKMCRKMQF